MKQLDLYILKELVKPFLAGIFAFIVIMLSNNLFVYSEMILKTGLPANLVLSMLLYSLPSIIVLTFPVGFMFATLLVLGRLSKDSELLALRACGISFSRAITPILLIATIVSYFSFVFNDNIVPYSNMQVFNIMKDMMSNQKLPPIKEKLFIEGGDKRHLYVEKVNREKEILEDTFIFDTTKNGYPQVISAKKATKNDNKWILKDGVLRTYNKNGFINYESKFDKMEIEIKLKELNFNDGLNLPTNLTTAELRKLIAEKKVKGEETTELEIDYYLKYSIPLATFFVALIAAPIGIKFAKMGTYFGVAISITLVFVWYLIYTSSRAFGVTGTIPIFWASWLQNITFGGIGITMLFFVNKK